MMFKNALKLGKRNLMCCQLLNNVTNSMNCKWSSKKYAGKEFETAVNKNFENQAIKCHHNYERDIEDINSNRNY